MSSSYRKACWGIAALAGLAAPAWAQQTYFVPSAELRGEHYTNRGLRPDSSEQGGSEGYRATLQARMGRNTPRSKTEFRPRLVGQEFPGRSVSRLEAFADLLTQYEGLRSQYALRGNFSRQDTYNAEFGEAGFSDFDPDEPLPPDVPTGVITADQTRTKYLLEPSFNHILTERLNIEGMLQYEAVRYGSNVAQTRVGYDAPYAQIALSRALTQRTAISVGPYVSRYEPDSNVSVTDAYGLVLGVQQRWSELSRLAVQLRAEHNETDFRDASLENRSSTDWGLEFVGTRQGQVSQLQYSIGRFLRPSGLGNRRVADQLQLQYNRSLSEKLQLKSAVRLQRDKPIGSSGPNSRGERNRAQLELAFERLLTRELSVGAGYRYAWQDLGNTVDSADNHTFFLSIGYRGRDPQWGRKR